MLSIELAVATAISLFGFESGAALATVVGRTPLRAARAPEFRARWLHLAPVFPCFV
jgi:hypothetical protein